MTTPDVSSHALRVSDLQQSGKTVFDIAPNKQDLQRLQNLLDLNGLRKVRFAGHVAPFGKKDWRLSAKLGATVIQPCVATLEDVTTRIDVPVERTFVVDFTEPDAEEVEMSDDDSLEPLGAFIDPFQVLEEALALALPLYPRADGQEPVSLQITEPGLTAMTDDDAKPFAALASLKDKLGSSDS